MFGISFGEFLIIFVVALVVIGPQKLPETIRTVGSLIHKIRSFADQVKNDVSKEFQVDDLKQSFLDTKNSLSNQMKDSAQLDDVKKSLYDARQATENSIRDSQKMINNSLHSGTTSHKTMNHTHHDHESHADIADYYSDINDSGIMTQPPKNYSASIDHHFLEEYSDNIDAFNTICQARQFELFLENEQHQYLTYQLKYSKHKPAKNLTEIIDHYYDTQIELNHN